MLMAWEGKVREAKARKPTNAVFMIVMMGQGVSGFRFRLGPALF
jgi:hypothetical protein